jgi:hypothetical protein
MKNLNPARVNKINREPGVAEVSVRKFVYAVFGNRYLEIELVEINPFVSQLRERWKLKNGKKNNKKEPFEEHHCLCTVKTDAIAKDSQLD